MSEFHEINVSNGGQATQNTCPHDSEISASCQRGCCSAQDVAFNASAPGLAQHLVCAWVRCSRNSRRRKLEYRGLCPHSGVMTSMQGPLPFVELWNSGRKFGHFGVIEPRQMPLHFFGG